MSSIEQGIAGTAEAGLNGHVFLLFVGSQQIERNIRASSGWSSAAAHSLCSCTRRARPRSQFTSDDDRDVADSPALEFVQYPKGTLRLSRAGCRPGGSRSSHAILWLSRESPPLASLATAWRPRRRRESRTPPPIHRRHRQRPRRQSGSGDLRVPTGLRFVHRTRPSRAPRNDRFRSVRKGLRTCWLRSRIVVVPKPSSRARA